MNGFTEISSRNNEKIKQTAALLNASERKKTGLFLIEGARLCEDAALNGAEIEAMFVTPGALKKYPAVSETVYNRAKQHYLINESVAGKLSDTGASQEIFAVGKQRDTLNALTISGNGLYLFCDNLQNPDNVGAVVRTAEALGGDGVILNGGCDVYAPKVLRASMGAVLRFPVMKTDDGVTLLKQLKTTGMSVYATMLDKNSVSITEVSKTGGNILVIGNEGNGVSPAIAAESTEKIIIPMKGKTQSLNAAAAAAIALWEFVR